MGSTNERKSINSHPHTSQGKNAEKVHVNL